MAWHFFPKCTARSKGSSVSRRFAQPYDKAWLWIEHPSSGVASCACLFFCLIRLRLLDSNGLELEWIAALETYTHPAFLGPVVSWLWSFLVLRDDLLSFLYEAYCLG